MDQPLTCRVPQRGTGRGATGGLRPLRRVKGQRTRTVRTLVCLVGAMTGTAALLGWMDPLERPFEAGAAQPAIDALSADRITHLAQSAVTRNVAIAPGKWRAIDIRLGHRFETGATASSALLLATSPAAGKAHFLVASDGRPLPTSRWRKQIRSVSSPHTVRIEVAETRGTGFQPVERQAGSRSHRLTPAQALCIRALVAALHEGIAPGGPSLPVRVRQRS